LTEQALLTASRLFTPQGGLRYKTDATPSDRRFTGQIADITSRPITTTVAITIRLLDNSPAPDSVFFGDGADL
jgi:hypothetical protein